MSTVKTKKDLRSRQLLLLAPLLVAPLLAFTGTSPVSRPEIELVTKGGQIEWAFNSDVLDPLGVHVSINHAETENADALFRDAYQRMHAHIAQTAGIVALLRGAQLAQIEHGMLETRDGPLLTTPAGQIDLRQARLKPVASTFSFTVTDRRGKIWATLDHPHYGLTPDGNHLWMRSFDVHVGRAMAELLGEKRLAGTIIGNLSFSLPIVRKHNVVTPTSLDSSSCKVVWPSSGHPVDLHLLNLSHDPTLGGLPDSVTVLRCGVPTSEGIFTSCTVHGTNGFVVISTDAAIKNYGTTTVPWYAMFRKSSPPYGNDQHPYLFMNLYRIDSDGWIQQIGASGVKHAYYPDNFGCYCPAGSMSYPTCKETYAAGTNDAPVVLGPRKEIIPATGQWGRCGSVFDPPCSGKLDPSYPIRDRGFKYRLKVLEADLSKTLHPNSRYQFEYGYVVRDEKNAELAVAHRSLVPEKTSTKWGVRWTISATDFSLGPAINAWVDPKLHSDEAINQRIATRFGHVRVAAVARKTGPGQYYYTYVVLNEDLASVKTTGVEPNLHIVSSHGLDGFDVEIQPDVTVQNPRFTDLDTIKSNDWHVDTNAGEVSWRSVGDNDLTWGTMFTFGFGANAPPVRVMAHLRVAGSSAILTVQTIGPRQQMKNVGDTVDMN